MNLLDISAVGCKLVISPIQFASFTLLIILWLAIWQNSVWKMLLRVFWNNLSLFG